MVTNRDAGSFSDFQRIKSAEYFDKFARKDVTWVIRTEVLNAKGRVASSTTTESTIIGDLQFGNDVMSEYIQIGIAISGDGAFYTLYSYAIEENNEIIVDGVTWKLVRKIEAEQTTGDTIYQGWIARRKEDS